MVTEFRSRCTKVLSQIRKNATFLTVHHYMNNFGEISNFSMVFHVDYHASIRRSKALLEEFKPSLSYCVGRPYGVEHLKIAREELLESFEDTLRGHNPRNVHINTYDELVNADGELITGIKLHKKQDILHLWGFGVHKAVIMRGNYPIDNRSLKTMAKDELRDLCPVGKFVQFKLTDGRFDRLVVQGITIRENDVIRVNHERLKLA